MISFQYVASRLVDDDVVDAMLVDDTAVANICVKLFLLIFV